MSAGNATTPQESIEAKPGVDEDVEMKDAGAADADADAEGEPDADADADGDVDAEGEPDDDTVPAASRPNRDQRDLLQLIETTAHTFSSYEEDGQEIAAGFQRIPNRRQLPDYFDVIKEPVAFSTIRGKIMRKTYTQFGQFVRDVALICHNAQVYNRPSAPIFEAALRLRDFLQKKLQEYVQEGKITAAEAELPDLGEIPPVDDDSPVPEQGDDEEEEEAEEEDSSSSEEEDESDEDGVPRRGRRRRRRWTRDRGRDAGDDAHKGRGRPTTVLTPLEGRTLALLRGLRQFKNEDGELRITPFERLPDKAVVPDYYDTIQNPIAIDIIKKKHKRKKYRNLDEVLADLELMFDNAKEYNEEGSELYEDAVELQKQARILAAQEKAKPDDEFRDEDGRLPLPGISFKGEVWKVGDWVHIVNPNDPRKPIVAQIFRTWQDSAGLRWINACWYYRPEQTVHRFEKHFYENEVFKTGQYRDHRVEEIDDRCFVMFITRYPRGRPRGFPPNKAVYVCESRYNDERHTFNKIKTWASCLPDEVREKDYEMDMFPVPHKMKKGPSPIKHLLREDAKESDPLPKPTWANPNAPPMIGAVHRRPREANESPPPQPSPPPTPVPPPQMHIDPTRRPSVKSDTSMAGAATYVPTPHLAVPSPSGMHYVQQFAPPRPAATPTPHIPPPVQQLQAMAPQMAHSQAQFPQVPPYQPHPQYPQQYAPQQMQPAPYHPMPSQMMTPVPMTAPRQPIPPTPTVTALPHTAPTATPNQYNLPSRSYEVFRILDPNVETAIPPEIRKQFHRDDEGHILFFASASRRPPETQVAERYKGLGHSVKHLAAIKEVRDERRRKRKEREEEEQKAKADGGGVKGMKRGVEAEGKERDGGGDVAGGAGRVIARGLIKWAEEMDRGTERMGEELRGWEEVKRADREERERLRPALLSG